MSGALVYHGIGTDEGGHSLVNLSSNAECSYIGTPKSGYRLLYTPSVRRIGHRVAFFVLTEISVSLTISIEVPHLRSLGKFIVLLFRTMCRPQTRHIPP